MKRIVGFMLALVLMVSVVAGCGSDSNGKEPSSVVQNNTQSADSSADNAKISGTINFWYCADEANPSDFGAKWHKKNIELFKNKYPEVKLVPTVISNGDQYLTKITTEMASGNAPDVFRTWLTGRLEPFVTAGRVYALNDLVEKTDELKNVISEKAVKLSTFNNKFYAFPLLKSGEIIFYNKQIFKDNGIAVPKTYNEFVEICKTLKSKSITPVILGNKEVWPGSIPYMALFNRLNGNDLYENVIIGKKAKFNDQGFIDAGKKLQELVKVGAFNENCNAISYQEATTGFAAGKAAMIFDGTWSTSYFIKELGDKLDFFNFPQVEGGKGSANDWLMNFDEGYAISSASKNLPAAEAFLSFMFSNERQKEYAEFGNLIACKNISIDESKVSPIITRISEAFDKADYAIIPWDNPLGTNIGTELNNTTQAIIANQDAAKAFDKLQKAAEAQWGK